MSNLTPEVRVNKNGVPVIKHVNANGTQATAGKKPLPSPAPSSPEPRTVTLKSIARDLEKLGVPITGYKGRTYAIRVLIKRDHEMLERVIEAITQADTATRDVWAYGLGSIGENTLSYNRTEYERMIANNSLTAQLIAAIDPDIIKTPRLFRTDDLAANIEEATGIQPGTERYSEVQAGIIYCAITNPVRVSRANINIDYLDTNRDDIMTIANNMDKVRTMLPELCKRRDASRHVINLLRESDAPSLTSGML